MSRSKAIASRIAMMAVAGAFVASFADTAEAQRKVRWKMPSSFSSQLDVIGPAGVRIAEHVTEMSDGAFELKFYEPNSLIPPLQVFDAVSVGSVESGYSAGGFYAGKIPAATFFSTVPFGPQTGELLAWMKFGGGVELQEEIYSEYNIKPIPACMINAPEAGGWFREEIKSADDLKGLKMRFYGLGARVMEKFGVSTQLLAPGDIYPALELGTIDATELSMPSVDLKAGFHQVAKHYYFPGWQQQSTLHEILANKAEYEKLPDHFKTILKVACGEAATWSFALAESKQFAALKEIQEKGVTIHTWPDGFLEKVEAAWHEVASEAAAKDPMFKKVYDSYTAFRADYKIWRDVGYLK